MMRKLTILLSVITLVSSFFAAVAVAEIKKGDSGDEVKAIQARLTELGYDVGDEDGEFGVSTKNAVFFFQTNYGLSGTGIVDDETYNKLFGLSGNSSGDTQNEVPPVTDADIVTLKSYLYVLGYGEGDTSPDLDEDFLEEWHRYQKDNNLQETDTVERSEFELVEEQVNAIEPSVYPVWQLNANGNKRYGLMNADSELVVPCQYNEINSISCGIILCRNWLDDNVKNLAYYYSDGQELVLPESEGEYLNPRSFSSGFARLEVDLEDDLPKYGYINTAGKLVIPCQYRSAGNFEHGYTFVEQEEDNYELIDALGNMITDSDGTSYESVREYLEQKYGSYYYPYGIAEQDSNGKYGYVNSNGEILIPYSFEHAADFSNGYAAVSVDGKCGYIDTNGRYIIEPIFDDLYSEELSFLYARDFDSEGYACVQYPDSDVYTLIDTNGVSYANKIWSEEPIEFSNGYARICQDEKEGFINTDLEVVVPLVWDNDITDGYDTSTAFRDDLPLITMDDSFTGGLALVKKSDSYYYINLEGEIILSADLPVSQETQETESKKEEYAYSSEQCKSKAINYLKSILKNPDSFQEHSTTTVLSDGIYTFAIDYSAMNSFGGYTRSTYACQVDANSGKIVGGYNFS